MGCMASQSPGQLRKRRVAAGCWGDSVGLLEVSPTIGHPPTAGGGKDRRVLVPLLPVTVAGWRMVPGALGLLLLMSPKEIFLPSLGL